MTPDIAAFKAYLLHLQAQFCAALEKLDPQHPFHKEPWQREKSLGHTHVLENGAVIERAGVNFSHVRGNQLPPAATQRHPQLAGSTFEALGVSLIVHPRNPYAPTCHFNLRCFYAEAAATWWLGGGFDLTPYYGFEEDCQHFHQTAKMACDPFGPHLYPQFKQNADQYFFLKHRQEPRGVGGLFFDDFKLTNWEDSFTFARSVGDHFLPAYLPILQKRVNHPYGEAQRQFQLYRRGRYVEFNLIHDRGTLFGLQFGGRTESILVSLPPMVNWQYDWQPQANTEEARLYEKFLVAQDWIPA
ncbi:MAG: oxygen-dependent coproporphyrinogen oxidase [Gammaproteobacteria bacterium]